MRVSATEAMQLGKTFFDSGIFPDIKTAQQAVVKIMAGAELGIPPFAAMSGIHIIQGKATIGAGIIAASVKGSGKYNYRVIEQSEKACSIDFYEGKEKIGNSTFTIEDAKKAQTKNIDKYPRNMLFARAISNGVKWYCPDVFSGPVYTPEDMDVVTEDVTHEEVPRATDAPKKKVAVSDKALEGLFKRLEAPGADIDKLVQDAQDNLALSDEQADRLVQKVNKLTQPSNA